jgi:hypothetical protein
MNAILIHMSRKLPILALLLLSLSAYARTRALTPTPPFTRPGGGGVSGIVRSVEGNLIRIADGLIVIDATGAHIVIGRGHQGTIAEIEPGMLLFASIMTDSPPSSHPIMRASTITASHAGDGSLYGAVQAVDLTTRSFVLLGQTIYVDDDTSFGGFARHGQTPGLSDIVVNQLVQVQFDAVDGRLLARDVLVLAPVPPQISRLNGTVKTIGTDAWTIEKDGETVTVVVNAQTKIVGSPKVGDRVEVIFNVDTANNKVAITIYKVYISPPLKIVQFHGNVKSVTGSTWVVTVKGEDKTFTVNERTKVTPDTGVGDLVQVLASQADDGTLTAITVIKLRF